MLKKKNKLLLLQKEGTEMIGDKKVLFSGMQATGTLTLGNYLGKWGISIQAAT